MRSNIELLDNRALAYKIKSNVIRDFETIYLSGNLKRKIRCTLAKGRFRVVISAPKYNIKKFKREGVIVYYGNGSYAQKVNETGGHSGKHVGYVERAITQAIIDQAKEEGKEVIIRYE